MALQMTRQKANTRSLVALVVVLVVSIGVFMTLPTEQKSLIKEEVVRLNELYCQESNAERRAQLIDTIRTYFPLWPEEGECGIRKYLYDFFDLNQVAKSTPPVAPLAVDVKLLESLPDAK